jgi:hypothetical protein
MAHNPNIAPTDQSRVCDICLIAGHGVHDGTTHHLLTGCCIDSIHTKRQELDTTLHNICNHLSFEWQQAACIATTNNIQRQRILNTFPFQWLPYNTNPQDWFNAILLDENALCFQHAREQTEQFQTPVLDSQWSLAVAQIAHFVSTTIQTHYHQHKLTRKLRTTTDKWNETIQFQIQKHNYTARYRTQFLV